MSSINGMPSHFQRPNSLGNKRGIKQHPDINTNVPKPPPLIRSVGAYKLKYFVMSYLDNPNDFQRMPEGDKNYIKSLSVSDKENIDFLSSDPDVNFRVQEIYNRYFK